MKALLQGSYLSKLSLVNHNFTDKSFELLGKFVGSNSCLEELDISYASGLKPVDYMPFFEALSQNKNIKSLNLSWCNFIEDQKIAKLRKNAP